MPTALAVPVFLVSLVVTLAAAGHFARTLDRLGVRIGLPEALLGLLTALAADGPEITSAIVALIKGAGSVSLGVVVGSNVFNLAAMVGVTAVLAGAVTLRREALAVEATVGVLVTLVATGVVLDAVPPGASVGLIAVVLVPYLILLGRGPRIAGRLPFSDRIDRGLARALGERQHWGRHRRAEEATVAALLAVMVPAVAVVVLGSTGMVEAALTLSDRWGLSRSLAGVLVLAPLTSIPNAVTAARLGLAGRGTALVSETLNSNTINLVAGVAVPALFVSVVSLTTEVKFDLAWLLLMTVGTVTVLARSRGCGRMGGSTLIGLYVAFVAFAIVHGS
jgi:cation:H+ antiporter